MDGTYFVTLANYNAWANRKLYKTLGELADKDRMAARPSFFGSIHATLNHILVGDRAWMARLEKNIYKIKALDEILYEDFEALFEARSAFDAHMTAFMGQMDEPTLAGECHYVNFAGETVSTPIMIVLAHMFNHQTHHRGQIHDMLSQTDVAPPALDIIYYHREQA